jgi:uncharacterized protein YjeT (DUF2065 family)
MKAKGIIKIVVGILLIIYPMQFKHFIHKIPHLGEALGYGFLSIILVMTGMLLIIIGTKQYKSVSKK